MNFTLKRLAALVALSAMVGLSFAAPSPQLGSNVGSDISAEEQTEVTTGITTLVTDSLSSTLTELQTIKEVLDPLASLDFTTVHHIPAGFITAALHFSEIISKQELLSAALKTSTVKLPAELAVTAHSDLTKVVDISRELEVVLTSFKPFLSKWNLTPFLTKLIDDTVEAMKVVETELGIDFDEADAKDLMGLIKDIYTELDNESQALKG